MSSPVNPGDILAEKYRVERILGEGGMGVVVAATHLALGQRVALKFLLPQATKQADTVARFLREAQAAVKLKGEHVARVTDVGTLETGLPYMVMEYLEGADLGQTLEQRGALSIEEAVDYVLQVCEAVAEAHNAGVIHRDLKPANLFLTQGPDGSPLVKVLDFGISKLQTANGAMSLGVTKTKDIVGSPYYMSPEQMRSSRTVDPRADIWSLGVILYELITSELPFKGDTITEICTAVLQSPTPRIRQVRADVPDALEAIILKCLERNLDERFQTVSELAMALHPLASATGRTSADRATRIQHGTSLTPMVAPSHNDSSPPSWGTTKAPRIPVSRSASWLMAGLVVGVLSGGTVLARHFAPPSFGGAQAPAAQVAPMDSAAVAAALSQPAPSAPAPAPLPAKASTPASPQTHAAGAASTAASTTRKAPAFVPPGPVAPAATPKRSSILAPLEAGADPSPVPTQRVDSFPPPVQHADPPPPRDTLGADVYTDRK